MAVVVNKLKNVMLPAVPAGKRISMQKINGAQSIISGTKEKKTECGG